MFGESWFMCTLSVDDNLLLINVSLCHITTGHGYVRYFTTKSGGGVSCDLGSVYSF